VVVLIPARPAALAHGAAARSATSAHAGRAGPVAGRCSREVLAIGSGTLTPQRPTKPGDRLTPAQQAVLELMAEGLQDGRIARRAGISTTTVRRHIAVIMKRLGVSSRFAAGAAAQRRGWIG